MRPLGRAMLALVLAATVGACAARQTGASAAVGGEPPVAEFFQAMRSGALEVLDGYLADDYLLIGVGGNLRDKAGRMNWLRSNVAMLSTIRPTDLLVRRVGDVAIVTGRVVIADELPVVQERFTHIWIHRGERWQMISGQVTAVAPEHQVEGDALQH